MILGIGIDLVDISRVERLLSARGERAMARLFCAGEVEYARGRARPAMHLAARVAAKEAAFKALAGDAAARRIGWREIEVVNGAADDGRPRIELHGRAAARAAALGVTRLWLTMSHSSVTACAMVVAEGTSAAAATPETA